LKVNLEHLQELKKTKRYEGFIAQIDDTIKLVQNHVLPKFKFLWGIEITSATRTALLTLIGGAFGSIVNKTLTIAQEKSASLISK
jgi:hypothetical protein